LADIFGNRHGRENRIETQRLIDPVSISKLNQGVRRTEDIRASAIFIFTLSSQRAAVLRAKVR
jgi:hypothetical protein